MLFSSKLNLTWISLNFNLNFNLNFHWTADTQTRGKLGNEEAGLIPSTRNIPRALQQWWRLNSRNAMVQRLKQLMSALAEEAGFRSQTVEGHTFLYCLSSVWNCPSSDGLSISCSSSQAQPKHTLHETILESLSSCWVPKALRTFLLKDLSYYDQ